MSTTTHPDPAAPIRIDASVAKIHHVQDRGTPSVTSSQCEYVIRSDELPGVVEELRRSGDDAAWAVFMFRTVIVSAETADDCLNLQYSLEQGVVGLDWVLLGPRNVADKVALTRFIRRREHVVKARNMNGVAYLRVENGDLCRLGLGIIHDFYGVDGDYPMGLLVQGFPLPTRRHPGS
jgi:hypothetical protein